MNTQIIKHNTAAVADFCFLLLAAGFIGICSQISVPIGPVPITGQTFAVMLIGGLLGPKHGAFAVMIYLFEGAIGLPVFAGGSFGAHLLLGSTGGYFLSFPCLAAAIGYISQTSWSHGLKIAAYTVGAWLGLAMGALWLSYFIDHAFLLGFIPFLGIEFTKALLVYAIHRKA